MRQSPQSPQSPQSSQSPRRGRKKVLERDRDRRAGELGRRLVSVEEHQRRVRAVAPLFAYLVEHGISASWLASQIGTQLGIPFVRGRMTLIKRGRGNVPRGFMPAACAALGIDPRERFGDDWMAEFGWQYDCAPFPGLGLKKVAPAA